MRLLNISEEVDRLRPKGQNKANRAANIEAISDITEIIVLRLGPVDPATQLRQ